MSKYDLFPTDKRTRAIAAIASASLAMTMPACAENTVPTAGECNGYKVVDVEPNDTYSELVIEHTDFAGNYDASQINDILHATYLAYYQEKKGELPDKFEIPVGQIDVRSPEVYSGETTVVPSACSIESNK